MMRSLNRSNHYLAIIKLNVMRNPTALVSQLFTGSSAFCIPLSMSFLRRQGGLHFIKEGGMILIIIGND